MRAARPFSGLARRASAGTRVDARGRLRASEEDRIFKSYYIECPKTARRSFNHSDQFGAAFSTGEKHRERDHRLRHLSNFYDVVYPYNYTLEIKIPSNPLNQKSAEKFITRL